MMRAVLIGLAVIVAVTTGCAQAVHVSQPAPEASATAPIEPAAVQIKKGDENVLDALIAAHQGQVVFVDYWATWCHPCVEYFPHTMEMSRKYKERGLATIAVSFDDSSDEEKVREFLARQGADFENVISSYDPGPDSFKGFDIDLVPHFRLYDRQGKLRHKWDAKPDDADEKIEELLTEKVEK
jgi:thiol-disulfide isomerase/thioredoxin